MGTIYEKAKVILENTINQIEYMGNFKTSVHIYNIACSLDNENPKSKIARAIECLFDIVDGIRNTQDLSDLKITKQYLKSIKSI